MESFKSNVTPWYGGEVLAGNCLEMAQFVVGAPVRHNSATDAANATKFRHATRDMPDAVCVAWFDHWGTYGPAGREYYANWGHVVIWVPGVGFVSSSPRAGKFEGPFTYGTLAEVERTFSATFRFWSEDLNGLRVCEPTNSPNAEDFDMPKLIQNYDKSVGFVSDAGMLDPISTMREVDSLIMTGVVSSSIVQFNDGTVWNALSARTARLKALQSQVDPAKLAAQVAALMVGPVVAALSEAGQLTQADVEAAVAKVTKEILRKAVE